MSRRGPRPIGEVLAPATAALEPVSTLAVVQRRWREVVGPRIAACAQPVAERDGVLSLACDDAVWAAELDLMGPGLLDALNAALGRPALRALKVRSDAAKGR